jgi:hypothetical protein
MGFIVEENQALDSVHIGFFGSDTIEHHLDTTRNLLKQFWWMTGIPCGWHHAV